MHSDSFSTHASTVIPMPSCNSKEFTKKKRGNRSAKLKQCKLDARREQWLSHVKKKGVMGEADTGKSSGPMLHACHKREMYVENLEIRSTGEKEIDDGSMHLYSDSESPSNSPASHISSVLGGNGSGTIFSGSSSSSSRSSGSSRSSTSSGSGGCCSQSISDEDEEVDDGCLDDWEAMADALAAADEKQEDQNFTSDKTLTSMEPCQDDTRPPVSGIDGSESKPENGESVEKPPVSCQAWRPDDAFRPQCLPNLGKQYSFPMSSEKHYGCGGVVWGCKNVVSAPTSCPICVEDLDLTDSSFLPCSCGYKLCLFCHKRILEGDGRCPGCRKQYDHDLPKTETTFDGNSLSIRLTRSCSIITRS